MDILSRWIPKTTGIHLRRDKDADTKKEDNHPQGKERGLEETGVACILALNFQPSELQEKMSVI